MSVYYSIWCIYTRYTFKVRSYYKNILMIITYKHYMHTMHCIEFVEMLFYKKFVIKLFVNEFLFLFLRLIVKD